MSFIHRSGPGPRVCAAFAAALLCLAAIAGPAAATEWHTTLRDPFVSPRTGTPATIIRFSVTFVGHGSVADAHVSAVIDGVALPMAATPGGSYGSGFGLRYRTSSTLPVGTHAVVFTGRDDTGDVSLGAGAVTITATGGTGTGGGTASPTPGSPSPSPGTGGDTPAGGTPGGDTGPIPTPGGGGSPTGTPAPTATTGPTGGGDATPTNGPTVTPAPPAPGASATSPDGSGSPSGSSTGGDQATRSDAPGPADQTPHGSGGGPASGGSPAGAPPTAGPTDGSDDIVVPSPDPTGDDIALGSVAPPGAGGSDAAAPGGAAGGSSGGDGRQDDRAGDLFGGHGGDIPAATRMLVTAISTTTTTAAAMAFFLFGKRRRDGEPPEPDEVLAARAATFSMAPASSLVPVGMSDPVGGARGLDETGIPRWRRPSLLEARKSDPLRSMAVPDRLSFNHGAAVPDADAERRRIRYRNVTLLDAPDELRAAEAGYLDEGDEVQLLQRSGSYWLVLCPNGDRGWVHRMVLGDVVTDEGGAGGFNAARRSFVGRRVDAGAADTADPAAGAEVDELDRSIDEDGTDLLSAYLRSRHA